MKVAVIMGGSSTEREVSLMTGREIMDSLDKNKYEIFPLIIDNKSDLIEKIKGMDFAFLALHGKFGEDGTIQGTLETLGIPYSGSGVISSAICMDKNISKKLIRYEGINTPDWFVVKNIDDLNISILNNLKFPIVIKPNNGGSSVGTYVTRNHEEVFQYVEQVLKLDREVIIENFIEGLEITCPILNGRTLPIIAIKPAATFFDYYSKYSDGGAEEYVVELDEALSMRVRKTSERCYDILKCDVYARVDMIIKDGDIYVLEVNTLPGMTKNSLFPKSAMAGGIDFSRLLDLIFEYSLDARR